MYFFASRIPAWKLAAREPISSSRYSRFEFIKLTPDFADALFHSGAMHHFLFSTFWRLYNNSFRKGVYLLKITINLLRHNIKVKQSIFKWNYQTSRFSFKFKTRSVSFDLKRSNKYDKQVL